MPSSRRDLLWTWLPRLLVAAGVVVLGVALVGVLADDDEPSGERDLAQAEADEDAPPLTAAPTESLPPVTGPLAEGRTAIPGFGEVEIRVVEGPDGEDVVLCVLLAETPDQRRQGLMQVTDEALGGYDGMLFTFPTDDEGGFWMKDTLLPLSIAYLDAEGAVVSTADMDPCPPDSTSCPTYPPTGPYRMALEVPQGGLDEIGLGEGSTARVEVGGACAAAT
jgi:uncharacterized membrane protein (UPF0127 family)